MSSDGQGHARTEVQAQERLNWWDFYNVVSRENWKYLIISNFYFSVVSRENKKSPIIRNIRGVPLGLRFRVFHLDKTTFKSISKNAWSHHCLILVQVETLTDNLVIYSLPFFIYSLDVRTYPSGASFGPMPRPHGACSRSWASIMLPVVSRQ
jgi:hypothetical protein